MLKRSNSTGLGKRNVSAGGEKAMRTVRVHLGRFRVFVTNQSPIAVEMRPSPLDVRPLNVLPPESGDSQLGGGRCLDITLTMNIGTEQRGSGIFRA